VISILKPEKDPAQLSSYRPKSLLDTTGKLFEKILLTRTLYEVSGCGLLGDEQFGFRLKRSYNYPASLKGCPGTLARRG
jgi:hypothetical protein